MSKIRTPRRATLALAAAAALGAVALPAQAQLSVGSAGTKATLGGYIKADALFNTRSVANGLDQIFVPTQIPVGAAAASPGERKQITFHARESRFFLRTTTPTAMGEMVTHLEMDFFSGGLNGNEVVSNSHGLRLRHAFGSLGPVLAGQTWTNFMEVGALPENLDFGGGVGQTFIRQPQFRYTSKFDGGQLALALENPETVAAGAGGAAFNDDRVPDVTANLGMSTGFGKFNLTGIVRRLRGDTAAVTNETDTAWGVSLYGVVPTIGKDTINLLATAGEGLGRYFAGNLPDAFVVGGKLRAQNQYAGQIAYRHFWTNEIRSTIEAAVLIADNSSAVAAANPGADERFSSIHANLLYSPVPNVTTGIEYRFGKRITEGNGSGNSQAIQVSAKFGF